MIRINSPASWILYNRQDNRTYGPAAETEADTQSSTVGRKMSRLRSPILVAVFLALLVAAGLLLVLLRPELPIEWLPFLIILLCPLLHISMHRRHGGHGNGAETGGEQAQDSRQF